MHSLRCLRIMQMRTIVAFGLFSSSVTFVLLVFHTRVQEPHDESNLPPGAFHHQVIASHKLVKAAKEHDAILAVNGKQENKDKFVYQQNFEQEDMDKNDHGLHSVEMFNLFANDTRPPLTVPRLSKYCNLPSSQEEGYEGLVPETYKLVSVQVVIRHGDRSPIYRLPSGHASDLSCRVDTSQFSHLPKVVSYPHVMAGASKNTPQSNSFLRWSLYPSHPTCGEGQLTGSGAVQHILNGIHLNQRYIHQLRHFPAEEWPKHILIHTTETSRTYQSALAFVYGFVSNFDITKLNLSMSPSLNFCEEHVFGLACQCPGLDALRMKAEGECKLDSKVKESQTEYKLLMDYVGEVLGISPNSIPGPTSLMDGLAGHTCHSQPYPCNANGMCITARVMERTWKVIDARSSCMGQNPSYIKFSRALMYGLLFRIGRNFIVSSENGTNAKFHLYSGHDTTVSPLIVALGISDNDWPGYAHRIVFELYTTTTSSKKQNFFRVLQNGKVVTNEVIFCRNRTIVNGLCDFVYFIQYLKARDLRAFCDSIQSTEKSRRTMKF